jgi:hypothetical protein
MQTPRTVEQLPCKLTGEELLLKSKQLAQLAKDRAALDDERKTAAARIKAAMDEKEAAMHALVDEVHSGEEQRPIECYERPRYPEGMVELVRSDSGAVVRSRPMHPSERQTALDMGEMPELDARPKRTKREAPESAH